MQKFEYQESEKSFLGEIKTFLMIFYELSLGEKKQNIKSKLRTR